MTTETKDALLAVADKLRQLLREPWVTEADEDAIYYLLAVVNGVV